MKYFDKEAPKSTNVHKIIEKIGKRNLELSNPEKVFWPKEGYTKNDLIEYYKEISNFILPYLKDRPESLLRFPDGIRGKSFYHKDVDIAPEWFETIKIDSDSENKKINYLICQNEESLIYLINLGCIDLNPWNSRIGHLDYPDYLILDLDPESTGFEKVVETALGIKKVLDTVGIKGYVKTSGATGIHIYVPLEAKYTYEQVRQFAEIIALKAHESMEKITSLERSPSKRKGKVYIDIFQNARGQTLASPYSVRAKPGATVSTPLDWKELTKDLSPKKFTIKNVPGRLKKKGDLFYPVLGKGIDMAKLLGKI